MKRQIRVDVETSYVPDQSDPGSQRYVFAYTITIHNEGSEAARLLRRHWLITDANGKVQEVRGDGVVGEQPLLEPGQSFEYTSGTPLETPSGFTLMAADSPGEHTPNGHISLSGDEDALLRGYWDKLSDGGHVDVPLEVAPWGDAFGQVKDRFGINWLVNIAGSGSQG